jgi:hypothetical protein
MHAIALALILSSGIQTPGEPLDVEATATRYETECAAGAAGADCDALRDALEDGLFDALVALTDAGVSIDRETVRVATRAQSPTLAAYALALLNAGFGPADEPYVRAALDSPYPQVRAAAVNLGRWFTTEAVRAPTQRAGEALADGYSGPKRSLLVPDLVPTAAELGAPLYPGALYSYLAGSRDRPVFLTADEPQKVAAFLAKGKPTFTAAEMTAAMEKRVAAEQAAEQAAHDAAAKAAAKPAPKDIAAAMAQAAEMMAAMSAGMDPTQTVREMSETKQAASHDWTAAIGRLEGIGDPRFVVVEEKRGMPTRVVAVYHDPAVAATAIAYLKPPGSGDGALLDLANDPEAMMRWQRWRMILGP